MPDEAPRERKYTTEFTLLVTVAAAYLLRAQDLQHVKASVFDAGPPCHLYVISRAPRISIDPASIELEPGVITGKVLVHREGETDKYPFKLPHAFGSDIVFQTSWPHEEFSILSEQGERLQGGVCALLGAHAQEWPREAYLHEILYVGQAFGAAGERTAWDRLKKHETLQKILADQLPDTQVWLTLVTVMGVQNLSEIVPGLSQRSDEEDNAHIDLVMKRLVEEGFMEREAVALAEAGLIRGWQPQYNDRMKYNFPARRQVSLETARDLDLHGLVIEWQSEELPARYWLGPHGPSNLFFFGFEVHLDSDRATTMSLQATQGPLFGMRLGTEGTSSGAFTG